MYAYEVTVEDVVQILNTMCLDQTKGLEIFESLDHQSIERAAINESKTDQDAQVAAAMDELNAQVSTTYIKMKREADQAKALPIIKNRFCMMLRERTTLTSGQVHYLNKVAISSSGNLCTLIKNCDSLPSYMADTEKLQKTIAHLWQNFAINMMIDSNVHYLDWVDCWYAFTKALPKASDGNEINLHHMIYNDLSSDRQVGAVLFTEHPEGTNNSIITYDALTDTNGVLMCRIPLVASLIEIESTLEIDCDDLLTITKNNPLLSLDVDL